MYFRFGGAVLLVVAIAVAGVALEKSTLSLRREISRQQFRRDVLHEQHARLRLRTQQLGAPKRVMELLPTRPDPPAPAHGTARRKTRNDSRPLLRWQRRGPSSQ